MWSEGDSFDGFSANLIQESLKSLKTATLNPKRHFPVKSIVSTNFSNVQDELKVKISNRDVILCLGRLLAAEMDILTKVTQTRFTIHRRQKLNRNF